MPEPPPASGHLDADAIDLEALEAQSAQAEEFEVRAREEQFRSQTPGLVTRMGPGQLHERDCAEVRASLDAVQGRRSCIVSGCAEVQPS